jgi:hypothetical protein
LRLGLTLLQTCQLRSRVIDQPRERRGDRALLDARRRRRWQLLARRDDAQFADSTDCLDHTEAGAQRLLIVRVRGLVVDHNFATLRNIELPANLPRAEDRGFDRGDCALRRRVLRKLRSRRIRLQHDGWTGTRGERRDRLPDLFRDERHHRVQQSQIRFQHLHERLTRAALLCCGCISRLQRGLRQFEIPIAVLVPGKFVQRLRREVEAILREPRAHFGDRRAETRTDPAIGRRVRDFTALLAAVLACRVHQHVARRVPQLVAEVLVPIDAAEIEADVAPHRRERAQREAQCVGAVRRDAARKLLARVLLDAIAQMRLHQTAGALGDQRFEVDAVDQVDRVDDVALRLRHLVPVLVADQSGDVHVTERHVAGELQAHHHHARDPEEDDVEAGHQHAGRIERLQLRRRFGPAERGERPQRRREPRVEHVLLTRQFPVTRLRLRLRLRARDIDVAALVVPRGNAMAPPQLPADAPVLDLVHPLEVFLRPALRHEARASVLDGFDGGLRERRDAHVPLIGQPRLEHRAAAISAWNGQRMRLDFLQQAERLEVCDHEFASLEAIERAILLRHLVIERRIRIEDVDERQVVTLADFVVVEVVPRRDLHAAGAERRIGVLVADHGDQPICERQSDLLADQVSIALVLGVHGHCGVAEHRFRPRRRNHQMTAAIRERIAQMPDLTLLGLGQHFEIRQRGVQHRIPVDEPLAAIDESILVQAHEHVGDDGGETFVHREAVARPIDGIAEATLLPEDRAARLFLPLPHALDESFAPQIEPVLALRVQLPLDHHLRGDTGVIGAGLPQGVEAIHAVLARERVHQRVLKSVAHVQRAGNVRRRDDYGVRLAAAGRRKPAVRLPSLVETLLDFSRVVSLFHGLKVCSTLVCI